MIGLGSAMAQTPPAPPPPPGVVIEGEDFKPQGDGWKVVMNGHGNYMVDIIGFNHISGERVLSAEAHSKDVKAVATIQIPETGEYRVWSRFETPTGTEEQFRVEIRQGGNMVGSAVMGGKEGPKFWFGDKTPKGQYDASWGSEGLAEQFFNVKGLQAGPAEITLVAIGQPEPAANRNVDFLFLTRDMSETWRDRFPANKLYPILDAALECIPPRYYLRLTAPKSLSVNMRYIFNRTPWYTPFVSIPLEANKPGEWIPLKGQDVCHFTTICLEAPPGQAGLEIQAEIAADAKGSQVVKKIEWNDGANISLSFSLPPYPNKYPGERVLTAEEQYREILDFLKKNPSKVGREPREPLSWGSCLPVWDHGRVADIGAELYHEIGMRVFAGFMQPPKLDAAALAVARERFKQWNLTPGRTVVLGGYRFMPTAENVAAARKAAEEAGVMNLVQRFDYGDEIGFGEWFLLIKPEEIKARFADWQQKRRGKVSFETPDSSAAAAQSNPQLYVDSFEFYEDASIAKVAELAQEIPKQLGSEVLYGANVGCHPFYYPEIAKYIKWFRGGAATFGRHSEYFWQIGQPGPLANAYLADHIRSGMRDNPKAMNLQYVMPHSPGNSDESFRRTAFSQLAHGSRGLDYFGIGVNYSFTENYIDFRDPGRYAAIRDINRAMALIEDILPTSRVVPSQVALILSDSTERWDFAGIAEDKANLAVFSEQYKKTRLHYHTDRLGIYYALVHGSRPPDLLIEEDVAHGDLKNYKVAYWVGDCIEPSALSAIEDWVKNGGRLFATAGAFRYDPYRRPLAAGLTFLGLKSGKLDEKTTFFRPQIELPHLAPLDYINEMPVFGVVDRIEVNDGVKVLARFKSGSPAVIERELGKGRITYVAALPGPTYFWSNYQPPPVPPRGVLSHAPHVNFNADARELILHPAKAAKPHVEAEGGWIDARLLQSPKGWAIPLANYSADVNKPITLTLRGVEGIQKIISANRGELELQREKDGAIRVTYPTGLGDILRIETK